LKKKSFILGKHDHHPSMSTYELKKRTTNVLMMPITFFRRSWSVKSQLLIFFIELFADVIRLCSENPPTSIYILNRKYVPGVVRRAWTVCFVDVFRSFRVERTVVEAAPNPPLVNLEHLNPKNEHAEAEKAHAQDGGAYSATFYNRSQFKHRAVVVDAGVELPVSPSKVDAKVSTVFGHRYGNVGVLAGLDFATSFPDGFDLSSSFRGVSLGLVFPVNALRLTLWVRHFVFEIVSVVFLRVASRFCNPSRGNARGKAGDVVIFTGRVQRILDSIYSFPSCSTLCDEIRAKS